MNKTQPSSVSVARFVATIQDPNRRRDFKAILALMGRCTGMPPKMWGSSIVGFDRYYYKYASGREGSFMIVGASPRKANLVLYIMPGYDHNQAILERLGKYKIGKACLYLKSLSDVEFEVLEELILDSVRKMRRNYPTGEAARALVEAAKTKASKRSAAKKGAAKKASKRSVAKKGAAKKKASKRRAAKKGAAKAKASKRSVAKKGAAAKKAGKRSVAKKMAAKKKAGKRGVGKKMAMKKKASKRGATKKGATKKASKRSVAKKMAVKKKASKRGATKRGAKKKASKRGATKKGAK